jgi:hypothetical protein
LRAQNAGIPKGNWGDGKRSDMAEDGRLQEKLSRNILKCATDPDSLQSIDAFAAAGGYAFAAIDYYLLSDKTGVERVVRLGRALLQNIRPVIADDRKQYFDDEAMLNCASSDNCKGYGSKL